MTTVKCMSEFQAEPPDEFLTATAEFTEWVRQLPADALLTPITSSRGHQRDPYTVTVGMRASWEETR